MEENTKEHPTASHPTAVTPSTATAPTKTAPLPPTPTPTPIPTSIPEISPFLQPTPIPAPGMRRGILPRHRRDDFDISHLTPAMPQPGGVPFLPKETGTGPSSRSSSVNPNDTLPPTPAPVEPPQPYPPQMRMPVLAPPRDTPRSTMPLPPGEVEQEVRPTTHLPLEDKYVDGERAATTAAGDVLPPGPVEASYTAAKRSGEVHPSGYKQNSEAMERPRYYGGQQQEEEETLMKKLGKWVEGINSKIVETGITGDGGETKRKE